MQQPDPVEPHIHKRSTRQHLFPGILGVRRQDQSPPLLPEHPIHLVTVPRRVPKLKRNLQTPPLLLLHHHRQNPRQRLQLGHRTHKRRRKLEQQRAQRLCLPQRLQPRPQKRQRLARIFQPRLVRHRLGNLDRILKVPPFCLIRPFLDRTLTRNPIERSVDLCRRIPVRVVVKLLLLLQPLGEENYDTNHNNEKQKQNKKNNHEFFQPQSHTFHPHTLSPHTIPSPPTHPPLPYTQTYLRSSNAHSKTLHVHTESVLSLHSSNRQKYHSQVNHTTHTTPPHHHTHNNPKFGPQHSTLHI